MDGRGVKSGCLWIEHIHRDCIEMDSWDALIDAWEGSASDGG